MITDYIRCICIYLKGKLMKKTYSMMSLLSLVFLSSNMYSMNKETRPKFNAFIESIKNETNDNVVITMYNKSYGIKPTEQINLNKEIILKRDKFFQEATCRHNDLLVLKSSIIHKYEFFNSNITIKYKNLEPFTFEILAEFHQYTGCHLRFCLIEKDKPETCYTYINPQPTKPFYNLSAQLCLRGEKKLEQSNIIVRYPITMPALKNLHKKITKIYYMKPDDTSYSASDSASENF